jgi:acyl-lipid omega-6 desaturase (Delta-12 desaturase)
MAVLRATSIREDVLTHGDGWSFQEAALYGSSHYDLPGILRWFTANIGVHHVHHLCSRIPSYRLSRVLREHPELRFVSRLTLLQSFQCVRLALGGPGMRLRKRHQKKC